jgi:membrane protein DedA with SNARE-associated domain
VSSEFQKCECWKLKSDLVKTLLKRYFWSFYCVAASFAGPLAGIAEMSYGSFFLWNLAGAIAWAFVMVTLAFSVGNFVP